MARKLLGLAAAALVGGSALPAHAALSPLYESLREIEAILQDPQLAAAFANQQAVNSIRRTGADTFTVETATCSVTVTVVDRPPEPGQPVMVGPRQFSLQFGEAACK